MHLNLAYRWFCRLGLEDVVPEHSTFSKNRHGRFRDSDIFRHVFESVLERCMKEGLVAREGSAIDASVVKADALVPEVFLAQLMGLARQSLLRSFGPVRVTISGAKKESPLGHSRPLRVEIKYRGEP
jgi:hypothetical protein